MDYEKVQSVSDQRKILSDEKLCFNCKYTKHYAADCRSNRKCKLCKCKHHTSNCEKRSDETSEPILAFTESRVLHPAGIITVNGIKCFAICYETHIP